MTCREKVKEFLINLIILIGYLAWRFLLFIAMTSVCIGISALTTQCYLYFNRVKLSTSLETFITIGCLVLFSFCSAPCLTPGLQRRIRQHPCMLSVIPFVIYVSIYIYSFMKLFQLYMEVHALPVGITNDAMYLLDETTRTPHGHIQFHSVTITKVPQRKVSTSKTSLNGETMQELIDKKELETAYFLFHFVYIIYVTCRIVLSDLEKNTSDEPNGSLKQLFAYMLMMASQVVMLVVYLFFIGFSSVAWISFCEGPHQCLFITETFSIIMGIAAAFMESGNPWPQKRENTQPVDPFGWYENLLRARFTVLVFLFAFVNWSFFEDRKGPRVELTERSFLVFIIIVTAAVVHVTKLFVIIAIKRGEMLIAAYRIIAAEDIELQNGNNNRDPENPPDPVLIQHNSVQTLADLLMVPDSNSWETLPEDCMDSSNASENSNPNDPNQNKPTVANNNLAEESAVPILPITSTLIDPKE